MVYIIKSIVLLAPKNPLKMEKPVQIQERMSMARKLIQDPRILVSDIEEELGTNVTYYSVKKIKRALPYTDFVWVSGMDNALSLHQWNHWKELLQEVPTVHLTRKPATSLIRQCPLRMLATQKHVFIDHAARYKLRPGITFWMLQKKMVNISSTEIRRKNSI